jgi:hypothetical protein
MMRAFSMFSAFRKGGLFRFMGEAAVQGWTEEPSIAHAYLRETLSSRARIVFSKKESKL